jgi:Domain of unknown function (DUF3883)
MRKFALKRLTASDLTFFVWHFRNRNAGNQKAINLNADVFVGKLFPSLPEVVAANSGRIPIDLYVYGPGLASELNLQRKIIKVGSYKNWRLDGEFIHDPETDAERFHALAPDDIVLLEFVGDIVPNSMKAFFLSQATKDDLAAYRAFSEYLGNNSMSVISYAEIEALIKKANPSDTHSLYELLLEADLEDAAEGGAEGITRLYSRRPGRRLSKIELTLALRRVEEIGQLGEELVNAYFEREKIEGRITDFSWESMDNAVAPFDFWCQRAGLRTLVDVKTTSGEFERNIHVSLPELKLMRDSREEYFIYRVYEIVGNTAKLRRSGPTRQLASSILSVLEGLPQGISADGISFSPAILQFEPATDITLSSIAAVTMKPS